MTDSGSLFMVLAVYAYLHTHTHTLWGYDSIWGAWSMMAQMVMSSAEILGFSANTLKKTL